MSYGVMAAQYFAEKKLSCSFDRFGLTDLPVGGTARAMMVTTFRRGADSIFGGKTFDAVIHREFSTGHKEDACMPITFSLGDNLELKWLMEFGSKEVLPRNVADLRDVVPVSTHAPAPVPRRRRTRWERFRSPFRRLWLSLFAREDW